MDILIGILTVVEVLVCLLLILIVLMQRPRQEGLGASFGDGMMNQIAGAQTTNVLQKFTVYLAVALFILTLGLAMLVTRKQSLKSSTRIFSEPPPPAVIETPKVEVKPADAAAPATEDPKAAEPTKPAAEAPKAAEPAKPADAPAMKEAGDAASSTPPAASSAPVEAPKPAVVAPATTATPAPAVPAAPAPKP